MRENPEARGKLFAVWGDGLLAISDGRVSKGERKLGGVKPDNGPGFLACKRVTGAAPVGNARSTPHRGRLVAMVVGTEVDLRLRGRPSTVEASRRLAPSWHLRPSGSRRYWRQRPDLSHSDKDRDQYHFDMLKVVHGYIEERAHR